MDGDDLLVGRPAQDVDDTRDAGVMRREAKEQAIRELMRKLDVEHEQSCIIVSVLQCEPMLLFQTSISVP